MKRFVFWFVLALIAVVWLAATRHEGGPRPIPPAQRFWTDHPEPQGIRRTISRDGKRVFISGNTIHVENRGKVIDINGSGVSVAYHDDREDADDHDDDQPDRVHADGLPIPVVPGTRVTEARIEPPQAPVPPRAPRAPREPRAPRAPRAPQSPMMTVAQTKLDQTPDVESITGRLSATEERAKDDAKAKLRETLALQLKGEVPNTWRIPDRVVDDIVRSGRVEIRPVTKDYGTLYEANFKVDHWTRWQKFVAESYRHEQVSKRMALLGGVLLFVIVCLAALSGYIRTDEATKGYYTNRIRLVAAAGVGAAGALLYRFIQS